MYTNKFCPWTNVAWTNVARTDVAWTNVVWTNVAWKNVAWTNGSEPLVNNQGGFNKLFSHALPLWLHGTASYVL